MPEGSLEFKIRKHKIVNQVRESLGAFNYLPEPVEKEKVTRKFKKFTSRAEQHYEGEWD